ncbi:MAG TPA: amino acid deaminase [Candidatus Acidoferrum sp.]|jgi:D-serine dehydratase
MTLATQRGSFVTEAYQLDHTVKGIPGGTKPFPLSQIADRNWNVMREDLPFPLMILKRSALLNNIEVMNAFLAENRVFLAPHAKTHMSPQLIDLQLSSGAWGITAGNVSQVQVFRQFGVQRIVLANQLVGRQNIRYIVEELNGDPAFDFFCFVDSVDGARHLASLAQQFGLTRPLKVLLEGGFVGGRTGCRTAGEARAILAEIRDARLTLALAGVAGFEGMIFGDDLAKSEAEVNSFLRSLNELLAQVTPKDLPNAAEFILTAGGSAYFDLVAKAFHEVDFFLPKRIVLRSGCYLTHDSGMYCRFQARRLTRGWHGAQFQPAFEIWSYVQSVPERGLAILTMGKRDCPYDYILPTPLRRYRTNQDELKLPGCEVTKVNDQHAYMTFPHDTDLRVGDRIVSGISHPCTAFDKWRFIAVVNDQYDVVDGLITYF